MPIVARMPEIRDGIASETAHGEIGLRKRRRIATALRETAYERAIVLPRSFKSALIPWFAGIPERTGFRGESRYRLINDVRPFDRNVLDQTVKRFVALGLEPWRAVAGELPNPALAISPENQAESCDLGCRTSGPSLR